ncbi:uncharacterized protein [Engystomops pustulosus]|uniref:uncharacterized protein isoform X2 n=1 Tax=Engystomops pustulosus TaxID=76066 RepID=UPI003AFB03FB
MKFLTKLRIRRKVFLNLDLHQKSSFFVALEQTKTNQRIRGDLPGDKASGIVPGEEKTSPSCSVPQTNQKRSNDARVGGRLKDFLPQWKNITNNRWVTSIIQDGYRIEFMSSPPHRFFLSRQSSGSLTHHLWEQVSTLQKLEVVRPVPPEEKGTGHYSPLFLIKKPNGSYRLIINLTFLNKWVTYIKFKMESIKSTTPLINHNAFLCTLNLRDAYYHIPIHADSQKFLRFAVLSPSGEESHFQFTALPFGLSSAPRVFTKVMAEVVKYLRSPSGPIPGRFLTCGRLGESRQITSENQGLPEKEINLDTSSDESSGVHDLLHSMCSLVPVPYKTSPVLDPVKMGQRLPSPEFTIGNSSSSKKIP